MTSSLDASLDTSLESLDAKGPTASAVELSLDEDKVLQKHCSAVRHSQPKICSKPNTLCTACNVLWQHHVQMEGFRVKSPVCAQNQIG